MGEPSRHVRTVARGVGLLALLALSAPASAAGSLRGVVVDDRREPVSGARVRLVPEGGEIAPLETTTGPYGGFRFEPVPDGTWSLEAEAAGHRAARVGGLKVRGAALPDVVVVVERLAVPGEAGPESLARSVRRAREEAEEGEAPAAPEAAPPAVPAEEPLGFAGRKERRPVPGDDFLPIPDRWRIGLPHWDRYPRAPHTDSPYEVGRARDPYAQNVLKGDYPIAGQNTFLVLSAVGDTFLEARRLPTPSGASARDPQSEDFFGRGEQLFTPASLVLSADLLNGNTAFEPPRWRFRFTPVATVNYLAVRERGVVNVNVQEGTTRTDPHLAIQELFGEARIATVSPRFDFVSVRAGIQPFNSDFRGFLFLGNEPGIRFFGNFGSNRNQWNAAAFYMLEKDTNSGLNTREARHQQVFVANYYRQDFLVPGYTVTVSWHRNRDEAGSEDPGGLHFDRNGFLVRPAPLGDFAPHDLRVDYLGFGGDGHIGRLNLTHVLYHATGHEDHNPIAARRTDVRAWMAAAEVSVDRDWKRYKASVLYATGDGDPLDSRAEGFDTILDSPNFAGGQASIWNRQGFRLTQTLAGLVQRFSLIPNLRTSKDEGQANFVNPGLLLLNVGADLDLTPKVKLSGNVSHLRFDRTETLELLLFQAPIRKTIGWDASAGLQYRPFLTDNVIVNGGAAFLVPGRGLEDLFVGETFLSAFAALTLVY